LGHRRADELFIAIAPDRMKLSRFPYRVRQLWRAARVQPSSQDLSTAQTILTPAQMALFARLQPFEQAHSLHVARALLEQGENDPDLLIAALLHDVGKVCQPLRLWERVWIVAGMAFFPGLARKWGAISEKIGAVSFFRRPFIVAEQHPAWGAELALQAGVSSRCADLIRAHQSQENGTSANPGSPAAQDRLLGLLKSVDDES
jgi:hypothetical protein